ncbi:MAG: WecB/TagA/CpsF family glycosyltransferase [Pseudomonadota bacterium]|uniref:WecB/TagA/CpsF family glycosyltransferase n=1 Tax=Rhizorhabdus phycosphaerae TaxID=2711156 RepID=UPI0013EA3498|nr:WecB/TagA/CpsF family glycosyltransferase [Rhizorhabdus phycosphaerae]
MEFLGLRFDPAGAAQMRAILRARTKDDRCAYIVTPNVDHVVRLADLPCDAPEWAAYREAGWCLCDSRILSFLARLWGMRLPVVTGSDLTADLFDTIAVAGDRVCVIGGQAADIGRLASLFPGLDLVQHIPPMGLRHDAAARAQAADFAVASQARFTLLAVGSPQQELIAADVARRPDARGTLLCVGASLDFLVGRERRAPRWMRLVGLEWFHRLCVSPRRMWRRYLLSGPRILLILYRYPRSVVRRENSGKA